MEDSNARVTVFAPTDDVFTYNPDLRAMDQKETLSHIGTLHLIALTWLFSVDAQVIEIGENKKWTKQTLIRSSIINSYVYITQFENNPGNFVSNLC
jgi:hypothetical protein